ncbi:ABC transporter related protein [Pirellula staleyi DSM 6068]|uniref:ABC transporter related protein n=1 Tax=Pirellula staleyi (strain ATCC 27377 / DSM 6068 / ICPB 4128) TaxID=530564 RepID=D2R0L5_PIRSD|nr:ABC transporter ATP-binding protein [Pirellula staleyi]ADB16613.1 ABC transporter related protein [Pirellula staleyi DSM 6068]
MNTGSPSPAVELRRVTRRFGSRVVLSEVNLTIARGEVFVLLGRSGSGKSTLLKLISGIDQPDEGEVLLGGELANHLPPHQRPVHTVFQNYALFPHLDVAGNVAFPLSVAGVSPAEQKRRVHEALNWVQLAGDATRRIDTLSGGERQRVALARALVNLPQCVLLDEPLSALDPHLRLATLLLLDDLQQRLSTTYLYITHDRDEAMRIGDRLGVLHRGRLVQVGSPEDLYLSPQTPYVASFLGRINWIETHLQKSGAGPSITLGGATIPVDRTKAEQLPEHLLAGIRPDDLRVDQHGPIEATVVSEQFAGHVHTVVLRLDDGTRLEMQTREEPPTPGSRVRLSWEPAALHLFPYVAEPDA